MLGTMYAEPELTPGEVARRYLSDPDYQEKNWSASTYHAVAAQAGYSAFVAERMNENRDYVPTRREVAENVGIQFDAPRYSFEVVVRVFVKGEEVSSTRMEVQSDTPLSRAEIEARIGRQVQPTRTPRGKDMKTILKAEPDAEIVYEIFGAARR